VFHNIEDSIWFSRVTARVSPNNINVETNTYDGYYTYKQSCTCSIKLICAFRIAYLFIYTAEERTHDDGSTHRIIIIILHALQYSRSYYYDIMYIHVYVRWHQWWLPSVHFCSSFMLFVFPPRVFGRSLLRHDIDRRYTAAHPFERPERRVRRCFATRAYLLRITHI